MKKALLFMGIMTLLTVTGCFSPGHSGRWDDRADAKAAPPAAVATAPEVIIAGPPAQTGALEGIVP